MAYKFRTPIAPSQPSTSTTWVAVARDSGVAWATAEDLTDWTEYTFPNGHSSDYNQIAYGKDGSGNPRWVGVRNQANGEIAYANEVTGGVGDWSQVNINASTLADVAWGQDKWVTVGKQDVPGYNNTIHTSTDGASWSSLDISGLTGIVTGTTILAIATNGSNTWVFPQQDRLYRSIDNAASFSLVKDFDDGRTIRDVAYSDGTWVIVYKDSSNDGYAAGSTDLTNWSESADDLAATIGTIAAGNGTYIAANSNDILRSTDGSTWTKHLNVLAYGSAAEIATDGTGNWFVAHADGGISYSEDDGVTWASAVDTGAEDYQGIAASVYLPV